MKLVAGTLFEATFAGHSTLRVIRLDELANRE